MRIKKIRIRAVEEFERDLLEVARAFDAGKTPKKRYRGEYFESLDVVREVLTDKRLELWRTIRDRKPDSISTLAKTVKRDFKAVHRDLMLLQGVGLLTFKKTKGKRGDMQSPISLADELQMAIA